MARRIEMDHTAAWLLAIIATMAVFGSLYLVLKQVAKQHILAEGSEKAAASSSDGHENGHSDQADRHDDSPPDSPTHRHDEGHSQAAEHGRAAHAGDKPASKAAHRDTEPSHSGKHAGSPKSGEKKHAPAKHDDESGEADEAEDEHHGSIPPQQAAGRPSVWSYEGHSGPEFWGELGEQFAGCQLGKKQSPVDLKNSEEGKLAPLQFAYHPTVASLRHNGQTLVAAYAPGSSMLAEGKRYELVQVHFHLPSEHTVAGTPYDLELHLVHQAKAGELAIVGVFMEESAASHRGLERLWAGLPQNEGAPGGTELTLSPAELLPQNKLYYTYEGSLTTPPCSEDVKWYVLSSPIKVSANQIERFMAADHPKNARPAQPLHKRKVYLSASR